jgi:hypothetical protein
MLILRAPSGDEGVLANAGPEVIDERHRRGGDGGGILRSAGGPDGHGNTLARLPPEQTRDELDGFCGDRPGGVVAKQR